MRACKFGCDELFERGYIFVDETGTIRSSTNLQKSTSDLKHAAECLIGKQAAAFRAQTALFFKWHQGHLPRKLKQS